MDKKSFLDQIEKPESFKQEEFIPVKNKKLSTGIISGIIFILIVVVGIMMYQKSLNVEVIDFSNQSIEEVTSWARNEEIILITSKSYDFDLEKGKVISQSIEPYQTIKKGETLQITVSDGPNPDDEIDKPALIEMTIDEINTWIKENKLTGIKFNYEYSEDIETDSVISIDYLDNEYPFLRSNRAEITISKGSEYDKASFKVPNFKTMTQDEALKWAETNKVSIDFLFEYSESIVKDQLIKQSIEVDKEVLRTTNITLTYSKGKQIIVPYFQDYTQEDAKKWAADHNIDLKIIEEYHDQTPFGVPIFQSIKRGTDIDEETELTLYYSIGKIDIESFIGNSLLDFENWVLEINRQGGAIKYEVDYIYSPSIKKRHIISHDFEYSKVSTTETIHLLVSRGSGIILPNFIGLSEDDAITLCQNEGISCVFDYQNNAAPSSTVVNQSHSEGSLINDKDILKLIISLGN